MSKSKNEPTDVRIDDKYFVEIRKFGSWYRYLREFNDFESACTYAKTLPCSSSVIKVLTTEEWFNEVKE